MKTRKQCLYLYAMTQGRIEGNKEAHISTQATEVLTVSKQQQSQSEREFDYYFYKRRIYSYHCRCFRMDSKRKRHKQPKPLCTYTCLRQVYTITTIITTYIYRYICTNTNAYYIIYVHKHRPEDLGTRTYHTQSGETQFNRIGMSRASFFCAIMSQCMLWLLAPSLGDVFIYKTR